MANMNMKTIFINSIILFGVSMLLPSSLFCVEIGTLIIYEQDFDTTGVWYANESVSSPENSLNGWWSNDLMQTEPFVERGARISNAFASARGNTLNLYSVNGSTQANGQAGYNFPKTVTQGSFEFFVRAPYYSTVYVYFGQRGASAADNFYLTITGTTVMLHANTPANDRISVQPWGGDDHSSTDFYRFTISFDEANNSVNVYLDSTLIISMENGIVLAGTLTGTTEGMKSGKFQIGQVVFSGPKGGGYSSIHIDDIVLAEPTLIFVESGNYKAVDLSHSVVKAGSALDLSGLIDAPAGKHGRLTVNEQGKLAFENDPTPFRFFGYNKVPEEIWRDVSDQQFEQNAINYAKAARAQGYNMVRLHGIDQWLMRSATADLEFNPQTLDRFDRIVAELKEQGIYVHYVVMSYLYYDVLNSANYWSRMAARNMHRLMFAIGRSDERERFSEGASRLLNHVNPYTGLAWKDDPAVAIVECFNEMYLGITEINNVAIDYPDEYLLFVNKWSEWLKERYEGELESELPEWMYGIDLDNPPVPGVGGAHDAAKDDFGRFLYDCVVESNAWGQNTLLQIGYDGIVTNTHNNLYGAAATWSSLSVADVHNYFEHPYGPSDRRSVGQRSSINLPWLFPSIAASRLYGRPFTVSEYNYPFWNQYQYEMPLTFGAYAAFQGFDGLEIYGDAVYLDLGNQQLGSFNVGVSPIQRSGEFLTAMFYSRGDVAPANNRVALIIPEEFLFSDGNALQSVSSTQNRLSLMTGFSLIFPSFGPGNSPNGWWSNDLKQEDPYIERGARISEAFAQTRGNTLNLYSQSGSTVANQQAAYHFSQNVTQGSFEFTIRKPNYNSAYAYFGQSATPVFENFYLTITGSSVLLYANSPGNDRIRAEPWGGGNHSSTDFYTFRIEFDDVNKSVSVYLDGTPIISMANGTVSAGTLMGSIAGMNSGVFQIGRVGFNGPWGGGYSSIHIDDIVLTSESITLYEQNFDTTGTWYVNESVSSPTVKFSEGMHPDLNLLPSGVTEYVSTGWSTEIDPDSAIDSSDLAQTVNELRSKGILTEDNLTDLDAGIYQSDTGEITLYRDAFEATVITPKTEAVAMLAGNNRQLGALTINSTDANGLFGLTAVDNIPLVESGRLVLVVATEVVNTGMELTSDRVTSINLGTAPVLMKTVNFSISLSNQAADQLRCFALRIDGERLQELPLTVGDGHVTLEVDTAALADGPTPFFELTTQSNNLYSEWIEGFMDLTSDQQLPLANPSLDGISNAVKFVLGMDPTVNARADLPVPVIVNRPEANYCVYDIYLNPDALAEPGLDITVEYSASLSPVSWLPVSENYLDTPEPNLLRVRMPVQTDESIFLRLKLNGI
ncbi:hypothetical protein H5P28_16580 [Ruficoccus amylovorans]|uniref:Glycoside hydrolase family 5 domain-containing protein n=1 Tax=Ruficoccus amylovorans TaxID=1804625 RepID=A0A842HHJ7_9BACT|nr:hypothetical protein [Ruficoccus amylovorans]MBC2595882.1 hypothetical protein [Ruficoccus amylovorans]